MDDDVRRKRRALVMLGRVIGRRIAAARRGLLYSQVELARYLGINRANLSEIETGKRVPTLETLVLIAWALGMHPSKLIPGMRELWQAYKIFLEDDGEDDT